LNLMMMTMMQQQQQQGLPRVVRRSARRPFLLASPQVAPLPLPCLLFLNLQQQQQQRRKSLVAAVSQQLFSRSRSMARYANQLLAVRLPYLQWVQVQLRHTHLRIQQQQQQQKKKK
jgi:hypothetical protein